MVMYTTGDFVALESFILSSDVMFFFFFQVSGGEGISVMLPKWSPDDKLLYINDKTNWWNLYQLDDDTKETSLCPQPKEIGQPAWRFGGSPYSCNPNGNGDILVIHGSV